MLHKRIFINRMLLLLSVSLLVHLLYYVLCVCIHFCVSYVLVCFFFTCTISLTVQSRVCRDLCIHNNKQDNVLKNTESVQCHL